MTSAPHPPTRPRILRRWLSAKRAERQRIIVDAAIEILQRQDLRFVTMRRVAARIGIGAMTLYTYVDGQDELRREMMRRGFEMLFDECYGGHPQTTPGEWRATSRSYVRFALARPRLYKLMFDLPLDESPAEDQMLLRAFQILVDRVQQRSHAEGLTPEEVQRRAFAAAARYWVGLHGLASLAISGRLRLVGGVDNLLEDLLPRLAPESCSG